MNNKILSPYHITLDTKKEQIISRNDLTSQFIGVIWFSKISLKYYYKQQGSTSYLQAKDPTNKKSAMLALDKLLLNDNYILTSSDKEFNGYR